MSVESAGCSTSAPGTIPAGGASASLVAPASKPSSSLSSVSGGSAACCGTILLGQSEGSEADVVLDAKLDEPELDFVGSWLSVAAVSVVDNASLEDLLVSLTGLERSVLDGTHS